MIERATYTEKEDAEYKNFLEVSARMVLIAAKRIAEREKVKGEEK